MKVCILGVGRSGTTALYHLLQNVAGTVYGDNYRSVYEPFLWGEPVWKNHFSELTKQWGEINSLSIDGIFWNKKIPLLVTNGSEFTTNEYLNQIFEPEKKETNLLVKSIRANGRYRALKKICPTCKFIFILRNPLDSINSAIDRFSFFGDEYHQSDFPRFIEEINTQYACNINSKEITHRVEKEVLYWYYMNKFALESFHSFPEKPLILTHENYSNNYEECIRQITNHLGIQFSKNFLTIAQKRVGPVTPEIKLTKNDVNLLAPFHETYIELLAENNIPGELSILNNIKNKYTQGSCSAPNRQHSVFFGKTSNHIRNSILKKIDLNDKKVEKQKNIISELQDQLDENKRQTRVKDTTIHQLEKTVAAKETEIEQLRNTVTDKQAKIEQLKDAVTDKSAKIEKLKNAVASNKEDIGQLNENIVRTEETAKQWEEMAVEKEKFIQEVTSSFSYKLGFSLTLPIRIISDILSHSRQ